MVIIITITTEFYMDRNSFHHINLTVYKMETSLLASSHIKTHFFLINIPSPLSGARVTNQHRLLIKNHNMPLRIKPLSLFFLILLIVCSSSFAKVEGSIQLGGAKMHESFMLHKSDKMEVKKIMSHRKLMFHSTADYDDAGPNPKHDPRRRPGGKP